MYCSGLIKSDTYLGDIIITSKEVPNTKKQALCATMIKLIQIFLGVIKTQTKHPVQAD